jgi:hypothetical protein
MHHLEIFAIHFLDTLFLVGMIGSAVVVGITLVRDFGDLFSSDKSPEEPLVPHSPKAQF